MSTLLEQAIQAHGGLDRWNRLGSVAAQLDIGGAIWQLKGQPGLFSNIELVANLKWQHLAMSSSAGGWRGEFTPQRVWIESHPPGQGAIEQRDSPRLAYAGHTQQTAWDRLHAFYFCSYALWTYLSIPFLYAGPGFSTEELPEWEENGEVWRRLKVRFPDAIASHSREQVSYFGRDGLLRRHDYSVEVMGGASGANYASNYVSTGGIMVPMSRRVYAHDAAGRKLQEPLLVSIDFHALDWRPG